VSTAKRVSAVAVETGDQSFGITCSANRRMVRSTSSRGSIEP
jgi:hypothetical protein